MEAPQPASNIEVMKNSIKDECKKILEKYLEERKYNKDKVLKWKEMILEDLDQYLKNKYPGYGFIISIFISEPISFRANAYFISRLNSDDDIVQSFFGDIYSEIRILFCKLYSPIGLTNNKYCDIFSDNMIKANELISNILNNKTYEGKTAADDINIICKGFNNYLLEKIKTNRPCFMNVGYILEKPLKDLKYFYKSIN
jgi:hypothetical protein